MVGKEQRGLVRMGIEQLPALIHIGGDLTVIGKAEGWEVVSRECPNGPLSKAAFWHIDQGKVQFLNAEGHPIALYGLTQVDRIAPTKADKGLYPMIRGYIS